MADNLLQQEFRPPVPNRCWAGDITYIRTTAGWRYLTVWTDLFSRRVVGWKLDERMDAALVVETLNRALGQRQVKAQQLLMQHLRQGLLLGQCRGGELLLDPQARTSPGRQLQGADRSKTATA